MFIKISNYTNKDTICSNCGSNETYIRIRNGKGYPMWYNYNNGKICHKCHNTLVVNIKYKRLKLKSRRLSFKGIDTDLSFDLPREKCEVCDITKKHRKIDRHHYFYCIIMPWACTISICTSCHGKISVKNKIGMKYKKKKTSIK